MSMLRTISIVSGSGATATTLASTAVGMVPAIYEALFIAKQFAVQTNQFNPDPTGYTGVAGDIINEIFWCKNILNKI